MTQKVPNSLTFDSDSLKNGSDSLKHGHKKRKLKQNKNENEVRPQFLNDFSNLPLKSDLKSRPIWVCQDGTIILEAFHPLIDQVFVSLMSGGTISINSSKSSWLL